MGELKPFPLSADKALDIIRAAARDSSRVRIPDDLGYERPDQDWPHVITHRQIALCLEQGDLIGKPETDEYGNLKCTLERFGGGDMIRVTVAAVHNNKDEWTLYVTDWSKSNGP